MLAVAATAISAIPLRAAVLVKAAANSGGGSANSGGVAGKSTGGGAGKGTGGGSSTGGLGAGGGEDGGTGNMGQGGEGGEVIIIPPEPGRPGSAVVAGGHFMKSANFSLMCSTGEGPGGNGLYSSPGYRLLGGVVGTTQP